MGLSASQGRLLLLTARRSDLEFRAQQISQKRLVLSQQLEQISMDYENATSNRQMKINLSGNSQYTDQTSRTANLTYAYLVSGTTAASGPGTALSGIQEYSRSEKEFVSATPYRLVSIDGAIVVSSEDEIPTVSSNTEETAPTQLKGDKYGGKAYKSTTKTANGTETSQYSILASADSALGKLLTGDGEAKTLDIDIENGLVRFTDDEGNKKMYNIASGEEVEKDASLTYNWGESAKLYTDYDEIPNNVTTSVAENGNYIVKGADGVTTLFDAKGSVVQRYIVDENLKYGTTDVNGVTDGPNYLQDCLRNGKYLIEKGVIDENVDEGFRWTSVSWDATTNISDSYYTEDDDAAKAKYDRLQTQIQAQDKKLELELDNIETQRNAVTTEVESVEKVISEDIEGTFNAFG